MTRIIAVDELFMSKLSFEISHFRSETIRILSALQGLLPSPHHRISYFSKWAFSLLKQSERSEFYCTRILFEKPTCSAKVRKTNLQCQVCRKTMIKWFLLTTWDKNSLIFSANWAEPGSQRKIKKNPDYQFQQGNCLLELVIKIFFLREKLILKNKKFSCVEGVIKLGLFRSKI